MTFYTFLVSILFIQYACTSAHSDQDHPLQMTAYAPVYPVLVGKAENPVYRLHLKGTTGQTSANLQEFTLDLSGTADLEDIDAVQIFYTAADTAFSATTLFAETRMITQAIQLSGNLMIRGNDHYFWISVSLKPSANLDHTIRLSVTDLTVDQTKLTVPTAVPNPQKRIGLALRQHNDEQVHTYRIPGLATTNEGTLIAVYDIRYNGSVDLQADIDVGMSRSTDGGRSWEPMRVIMDRGTWGGLPEEANGIGDPCVLVDRQTNTIWVAGLWFHGHGDERAWFASQAGLKPEQTGQFLLVKSEDDGRTWSEPINITAQIKDPGWQLLLDGPGKGISLEDGTLVFPAQFKDENEVPHSAIVYSRDHGASWSIGTGAKSHTTEAQVVELADHSLMLNMRDDRGSGEGKGTGARSVMITDDLGQTWKEHPTSRKDLPEPVCMASLITHRYQGKELFLFSNPFDQLVRRDITIKVSEDQGMSWPEKHFTLLDAGAGRGYSCLTVIDENTIGILYEGSQADLVFQRLRMQDLVRE